MRRESTERYGWIDLVKIYACILVTVGHFFPSMVGVGLLPETAVYNMFQRMIYSFHVPLFFVCSGYLHQSQNGKYSVDDWLRNTGKKALSLGVPYFAFSIVTWILKTVFSGAVNNALDDGLWETLLLNPIAPYWYLYALFFIFLVSPKFDNNGGVCCFLIVAILLKFADCFLPAIDIYAISSVVKNLVWFAAGMAFVCVKDKFCECNKNVLWIGSTSAVSFFVASMFIAKLNVYSEVVSFLMGIIGCCSTILIAIGLSETILLKKLKVIFAKYTMPVFLMHTIFAAGLRSVLLKIGVNSAPVHVILGLGISFAGPIAAAVIMERTKLDFLMYPGKYIKFFRKTRND